MSKSKNITPAQYINNLDEPRKSEIKAIDKLIQKTTKLKPFLLDYTGLAYGPLHYKYVSGREGDFCAFGLSSRKNYISFYACMADDEGYVAERYIDKLPKANIGKSCVRFKKLSDIDLKHLVAMIQENMAIYKKFPVENGVKQYVQPKRFLSKK